MVAWPYQIIETQSMVLLWHPIMLPWFHDCIVSYPCSTRSHGVHIVQTWLRKVIVVPYHGSIASRYCFIVVPRYPYIILCCHVFMVSDSHSTIAALEHVNMNVSMQCTSVFITACFKSFQVAELISTIDAAMLLAPLPPCIAAHLYHHRWCSAPHLYLHRSCNAPRSPTKMHCPSHLPPSMVSL